MFFEIEYQDSRCKARAGKLTTDHGVVQTPIFMPVGTIGTVKTLSPQDLFDCQAQIMLSNTYHLYLRPGMEVLAEFGGLHQFNRWNGPILTDSGGFQIYSLSDLKQISRNGVEFKSHWDGSRHIFTPESVVDIQRDIGSDIMMVLDYLTGNPSEFSLAEEAHQHTLQWAKRAREHFLATRPRYGYRQYQFGIVQGGVYKDLRQASMARLMQTGFDGYAIGGLAVGEDAQTRRHITDFCTGQLPPEKPRYLMGVGKPEDILDGIELGVDMFDCVIPTRNARNGTLFTRTGKINIRNSGYKLNPEPVDPACTCYCCRNFSLGYLHHLFRVGEVLGLRLATLHNVTFYLNLVGSAREAILNNRFPAFKEAFLNQYFTTEENRSGK